MSIICPTLKVDYYIPPSHESTMNCLQSNEMLLLSLYLKLIITSKNTVFVFIDDLSIFHLYELQLMQLSHKILF